MIRFASIRYSIYALLVTLIFFGIPTYLLTDTNGNTNLIIALIAACIPGFITGINWRRKFQDIPSEGDLWKLAFIFTIIKIVIWTCYLIIIAVITPEFGGALLLLISSGLSALLIPVLCFYCFIVLMINRFSFPLGFKMLGTHPSTKVCG